VATNAVAARPTTNKARFRRMVMPLYRGIHLSSWIRKNSAVLLKFCSFSYGIETAATRSRASHFAPF
jgi:hypothetical protein